MSTKVCSKCKHEKALTEFHNSKLGKFGKRAECKSCGNKNRRRSPTIRAAERRANLRRYGLDNAIFEALRLLQNGKCAICGLPETSNLHGVLFVDHSHETNKVRGLLCLECNSGLGKFRDNPELMRKAANYVEHN